MTVLVGLGNPGRKYSDTKHNFGFWILDQFTEKKSLIFQAGIRDYLIANKERLICIKPTTFMNLSGKAVKYWLHKHKVVIKNILVLETFVFFRHTLLRFLSGHEKFSYSKCIMLYSF